MSLHFTLPDTRWTEQERLACLQRYEILDAPREQDFDDIVQIAAESCDTPIALVSLVGSDRLWFVAETGIGSRSLPLDGAICPHGLMVQDLLVMRDAGQDPRFRNNPLVKWNGARFYAGAPLITPDGFPLGTICVMDTKPRDITPAQGRTLKALARQVMTRLELRRVLRTEKARERAADRTRTPLQRVLDTGPAAFFEWDVSTARIRGDRKLAEFHGLDPSVMASGVLLADVFGTIHPEDRAAVKASLTRAADTASDFGVQFRLMDQDGREHWVLARGRCCSRDGNRPLRYSGVVIDISPMEKAEVALRRSQAQQQTVIKELAHRTKNTLAIVQALANQTMRSASSLEEAKRSLNAWLPALAHAVDALIQTNWTGAEMQAVVRGILPLCDPDRKGRITFSGPDLRIGSQATLALTLALHELATNAMKYGALSTAEGQVELAWQLSGAGQERRLHLIWKERGGPPVAVPLHRGFGSRLIKDNLEAATRGSVDLAYPVDGFSLSLDAPLENAGFGNNLPPR
ncbi:HWE histidine kinase domain-containing protein [Roseomonas xinghualingensis]|uniref:HWE histidine kinase domain-containing protein n=1 Tax=Roseomonas xinghualingensis TaxID=2986475 RepID=UPI0021F15ED9|nr:HWE histidine kinase domain-containing protein [Roseomonas sp. SXEYE001]MCV4207376.1 PAS domain-containing protein [Roseomonas sp. SXEYE001]